ncbi:hydantoinase/oxoprolinase family protein [Baekduia soli]|uniref:hydantoinase/oxoprolinase family protein n=1 Tax=Baekduia soli TaxID=496014 RepID=UPI00389914C5
MEAIAIALLWAFRHPVHEQRLAELVAEEAPGVFVTLSSEAAPRQGEYERTVATVINAYVGPASSAYLDELADAMGERGLPRAPMIMQGNGGVMPVDVARRLPVTTIGSGPAGGLAGAAAIATASGHPNVIATDMGGTSFEVGLIVDGRPLLTGQEILDQYTFHMPRLDVRSIACGGGSIAAVDPHGGGLRVGPESAGSDPGPACYGRGAQPTVTDADIVLGLLDPDAFLGGRMTLDRGAAERAVAGLAEQLGLSVDEAAAGILRVNAFQAGTLIRQRTIEQGLDPRDFVVYAFGGAGPLHAFAFAEELGVGEVVVPLGNGASTLSAYGIAASDLVRTFEQECRIRTPLDPDALSAVLGDVSARARAALQDSGHDPDTAEYHGTALMRYAEQFVQELPIELPERIDAAACAEVMARFDEEYGRLFGAGARAVFQAAEVFTVRLTTRIPLGFTPSPAAGPAAPEAAPASRTRDVYWPAEGRRVATAIVAGAALPAGEAIHGPAVIELPHTAVAVARGQRVTRDALGSFVLTIADHDPGAHR